MALLDHFHPPLSVSRPWEGFHSAWATAIAQQLNDAILPRDYVAMPQTRLGSAIEMDDVFEVHVFRQQGSPNLVAAIELVSPANKDRHAHRQAFAGKCAGLLRQGVGVLVVDIVTDRQNSLHEELVALLELNGSAPFSSALYAVSYRTADVEGQSRLEIWTQALALGQPLATMPLWLNDELAVPVDLDTSDAAVCKALRIR